MTISERLKRPDLSTEEIGFLVEHIVGGEITVLEAEEALGWLPGILQEMIDEVMSFKTTEGTVKNKLLTRKSRLNSMKFSELEPSTLLNKVANFQTFNGEVLYQQKLDRHTVELRAHLHMEEAQETMEALTIEDDVEVLDGLCDIEFVNLGGANISDNREHVRSSYSLIADLPRTALAMPINMIMQNLKQLEWHQHGLISYFVWSAAISLGYTKQQFLDAFLRVYESNMTKFCKTDHEARVTQKHILETKGLETKVERVGDVFVVRRLDGKTLKSVNYTPVYLKDIVEQVYGK